MGDEPTPMSRVQVWTLVLSEEGHSDQELQQPVGLRQLRPALGCQLQLFCDVNTRASAGRPQSTLRTSPRGIRSAVAKLE